jgi:hypothetical protein
LSIQDRVKAHIKLLRKLRGEVWNLIIHYKVLKRTLLLI